MIASLPAYFLSMGEKFGKPEKVSKPIICLSKLTCSKIALNYAKVINPLPNKTPHSIIEPGTSKIFLKNSSIPQYLSSGMLNHEVSRSRKLLFKKKEIKKMLGNINKKGTTLVPLKIYFSSKGFAKLLIAIGEGKKKYDKRQIKKEKEWKRQKKLI